MVNNCMNQNKYNLITKANNRSWLIDEHLCFQRENLFDWFS
ncbi:hypothetical protein FUAX_42050 (plasmid) [Fulvitalea axinellae]|uniref:Transposase n=1 Tax=Fulvitalea axinellae TaxID=1182444 RepID=A0AAU9CNB5_9BACT|nr:hypothetical protein FUAX_42050 [Fulvitalea axinellae]